jgi:hypothetical protein
MGLHDLLQAQLYFLLGYIYIYIYISMLGGFFVTTAWRGLRLQMGETASSYGG